MKYESLRKLRAPGITAALASMALLTAGCGEKQSTLEFEGTQSVPVEGRAIWNIADTIPGCDQDPNATVKQIAAMNPGLKPDVVSGMTKTIVVPEQCHYSDENYIER